jgi:N utilization substance protein B
MTGQKPARMRPPAERPRTGARIAAVQALFQSEQTGEAPEAIIDQFIRHRIGPLSPGSFEDGRVPKADVPLFTAIVRAASAHAETLDGIIAAHLSAGWPLHRLDPVLRALLRAACAELWSGAEPPAKIIIKDYLDVAHGFFGGEEPRFANGVLDAIARQLRAAEFAPQP